jgi:hypothetical protein
MRAPPTGAATSRPDSSGPAPTAAGTSTWFVDCKHYKTKGVPPEALQGLLSWAQAERPDVALVIASGFLSNPAKDYLRSYKENNHPPFRIASWERPILDKLGRRNRDLLSRSGLTRMRTESEVIAAEEEFFDRVWYERHLDRLEMHESDEDPMPEHFYEMAQREVERVKRERPDLRRGENDFEWGMWQGKLSALRWARTGISSTPDERCSCSLARSRIPAQPFGEIERNSGNRS